jgi:hypothetical protein
MTSLKPASAKGYGLTGHDKGKCSTSINREQAPNAQSERPDISFLAEAGDPAFLNLLRFVLD